MHDYETNVANQVHAIECNTRTHIKFQEDAIGIVWRWRRRVHLIENARRQIGHKGCDKAIICTRNSPLDFAILWSLRRFSFWAVKSARQQLQWHNTDRITYLQQPNFASWLFILIAQSVWAKWETANKRIVSDNTRFVIVSISSKAANPVY